MAENIYIQLVFIKKYMNTIVSLSILTLIIIGTTVWLIYRTLKEGYKGLDEIKKNN